MRNDARPVGEHSPASPTGPAERDDRPTDGPERGHGADERDARESVTHDRQSHIVHPSREGHGDETD